MSKLPHIRYREREDEVSFHMTGGAPITYHATCAPLIDIATVAYAPFSDFVNREMPRRPLVFHSLDGIPQPPPVGSMYVDRDTGTFKVYMDDGWKVIAGAETNEACVGCGAPNHGGRCDYCGR